MSVTRKGWRPLTSTVEEADQAEHRTEIDSTDSDEQVSVTRCMYNEVPNQRIP